MASAVVHTGRFCLERLSPRDEEQCHQKSGPTHSYTLRLFSHRLGSELNSRNASLWAAALGRIGLMAAGNSAMRDERRGTAWGGGGGGLGGPARMHQLYRLFVNVNEF